MLIVAIDNHAAEDKYIGIRCQSTGKPNKTNLLAALSSKLMLALRQARRTALTSHNRLMEILPPSTIIQSEAASTRRPSLQSAYFTN